MVAAVLKRVHLWLLSVIGIFIIITITCSEASSMVNRLDKVTVINGSSSRLSTEPELKDKSDANSTNLLAGLEKTSFKCKGKPQSECEREYNEVGEKKLNRSSSYRSKLVEKVAAAKYSHSKKISGKSKRIKKMRNSSNKFSRRSSGSSVRNSDYLPVKYGPYGYEDEMSEGRGWITVPLFIIFSIIQFKLVSAIFLAFFGPMILFLLIVQGFLFKATLVLLGLMMT